MEERGGRSPEKNFSASVAVGDGHCAAGCTLGDIIGSPTFVVVVLGRKLFGLFLFAKYVDNYVLAYVFGITFKYYSTKPMKGLSVGQGVAQAIKSDNLSLTSFQVGLDGWMAIMQLVLFPIEGLHPDEVTYWFPRAHRGDPWAS